MSSTLIALIPLHRALRSLWTSIALGASVVVLEEAAPVLAGFSAHQGTFPVWRAALACAIGGWVTTIVPYFLGRWGAPGVIARWPAAAETIRKLTGVVARRPWRAALASRFVFGARTLLPLACGSARVALPPFLIGSALSSAVWAAIFVSLGWMFGDAALLVLGNVRRHENIIALVLGLIVILLVIIVQRRNRPHVIEELEGSDAEPAPRDESDY